MRVVPICLECQRVLQMALSIKELASVMGRDLRFKAASSERELRLLYQFV